MHRPNRGWGKIMFLFQRKGKEACVTGIEEAKRELQEGFVSCKKTHTHTHTFYSVWNGKLAEDFEEKSAFILKKDIYQMFKAITNYWLPE